MTDTTPTARLLSDGHVEFTHLCISGVIVATLPQPKWRVVQEEPLTVEPSISCFECSWHGHIFEGKCWPPYPSSVARQAAGTSVEGTTP